MSTRLEGQVINLTDAFQKATPDLLAVLGREWKAQKTEPILHQRSVDIALMMIRKLTKQANEMHR